MKKIIPIKDLRNTVQIDKLAKEINEPIFVTKNGYNDLVIMSHDYYEKVLEKREKTYNQITSTHVLKDGADTFGYVRLLTKRIDVEPADIERNKNQILEAINSLSDDIDILLFQELTLTGSTLDDVLIFDPILKRCESAIKEILVASKNKNTLIVFGSPLKQNNKVFNVAISVFNGQLLSITPKLNNGNEQLDSKYINMCGQKVIFGLNNILISNYFPNLRIGIEVGDDILNPHSNMGELCKNGANLILNISAMPEFLESKDLIKNSIQSFSKKFHCAYCFVNAGYGESTSDCTFGGQQYVFEDGELIQEITPFSNESSLILDLDIDKISKIRMLKKFTFEMKNVNYVGFDLLINNKNSLKRKYYKNPFLKDEQTYDLEKINYILNIQANGLIKRLKAVKLDKVVLGLSGGLDSTLALIVAVEAFKKLNFDLKNIICITMPAFGTTSKTKNNSLLLAEKLGVSIREINISDSVIQHLKDIGHDLSIKDIAYENAQARERTQVLMDIANKEGALQLGTGDLSELCLGWCTYNGDQMSMYSINSSIPKTMVKYLCGGYSLINPDAKQVLEDIINTPVSPELIPGQNDKISQKTEDIIGPYFLHDFFIYHFLSYSPSPKKLFFMAVNTFKDDLSKEEILKWLKLFYRRFFQNHFKRSASPDGIKISQISISKKDLSMPSDCSATLFLNELDQL